MNLVIITGMSGAGKTSVIKALEDIGYFCIDNLPPKLLSKFVEISSKAGESLSHIAAVTDVRSKTMFNSLFECLEELDSNEVNYKLVFLDASNESIIKRYKETRRKHPLQKANGIDINTALKQERELLKRAKEKADYTIDTTMLNQKQVQKQIISQFSDEDSDGFTVNVMSFGYKYGIPLDADIVFDTRCFKNPFYIPELKEHTGQEDCIKEYVFSDENAVECLHRIKSMLDFLIPLYRDAEGKAQLNVCIGCTGGKHRSVAFAESINTFLLSKNIKSVLINRDISKIKN